MAIILDCFHSVGIFFSMNHLFTLVSSHMWALGPRLFCCSTKPISLPAALLLFSIATPFLYSSSLKGCTFEASPSVAGGSTGRFGLEGMVHLPLTWSWCATWFALTKHGVLDVVGSFDSFLMVFHALRLLRVILVNVMTSSHLFLFSSVIKSIIVLPDSMVPGLLE